MINPPSLLYGLSLLLILGACSTPSFTPPDPTPSTGHISPQSAPFLPDTIPPLVPSTAYLPKPQGKKLQSNYTLVAQDMPIQNLLQDLAQQARLQLDIYQGVSGLVTISAQSQPLEVILQRLSDQVSILYEVKQNRLIIRPDTPYWQSYAVDYVNIQRNSTSSIRLSMDVGQAQESGNTTNLDISTANAFWQSLATSLSTILGISAQNNAADSVTSPTPEPATTPTAEPALAPTPAATTIAETPATIAETPAAITPSAAANGNTPNPVASNQININAESGLVSIYANSKSQAWVRNFIEQLIQIAQRQVMIEVTVVEVQLNKQNQAGVDWQAVSTAQGINLNQSLIGTNIGTTPALTLGVSQTGDYDINASLKAIAAYGETKVLSSPKIMAMNNQTALLKVVENEVYFTTNVQTSTENGVTTRTFTTELKSVPVGFTMSITPFINQYQQITLNIRPSISRIVRQVRDPNPDLANANVQSFVPVIQTREMESVLKINDEQVAILGGLMEDSREEENQGVPVLGQIPYLGQLFSYRNTSRSKSELVLFIRPRLVKSGSLLPGVNESQNSLRDLAL